MKKILSLFVVAAAFAGCSKSSNSAPANSADVMFVNGCAGTGSVYVTDGSTKVTGASNVAFAGTSGYQYITAGSPDITFYVSSLGGTDPLKSFCSKYPLFCFCGGHYYQLILRGYCG